ncbi:hypothetical protein PPYR_05167 [Photinus pyralis]|uniref:Tyr recombinase domain-containing protein n=1 Tax=Photinus pyralis TaxID=7054 RepID=A0A5N4B044_PHOPY|nr:hypothetical protein PPYR_05167 [Photinus pyralis]
MKVVLIMGYCGVCRREELTNMSVNDVEYKADSILISVPKTKNNVSRLFAVTDTKWINIIKTYTNLRPSHINSNRFFLNYRNGSCTVQPIGINKIGKMPDDLVIVVKLFIQHTRYHGPFWL